MKKWYLVPVAVILVFLLGGCFSFDDMLNGRWEGVLDDYYRSYDVVLIVNSNNTGSISFDYESYGMDIVNRRANRSFVGEYGWYDSYWIERTIHTELINYGTLRIKIFNNLGDLISDGFLYK